MKKILNNETLTINGSGEQFRQFIYVKDLAKGNVACLHENAKNQIININGNEKITVLDIVKNIESISGIDFLSLPADDAETSLEKQVSKGW